MSVRGGRQARPRREVQTGMLESRDVLAKVRCRGREFYEPGPARPPTYTMPEPRSDEWNANTHGVCCSTDSSDLSACHASFCFRTSRIR